MDPAPWAACQQDLAQRDTWIIDGDLGPYGQAPGIRLCAADTIIVVDLAFPRCEGRTLRLDGERAGDWRWVWACRRRYLPQIMKAIAVPHANG